MSRVWIPSAYCDEVTPPGRKDPSDWIVGYCEDGWRLANAEGENDVALDDEDSFRIVAAVGEVLPFAWTEGRGSYEVTIHPDGSVEGGAGVPEATHYWCEDMLADSLEEFGRVYAESYQMEAPQQVTVALCDWSEKDHPHRLVVENGVARFFPCAGERLQ